MNQRMKFENRVAIVTGGARGIGKAYCEAFAANGARVVVADILRDCASNTAAAIASASGIETLSLGVDVADETNVRDMFDQVERKFGRVDFLVNNAAIMLGVERPFKPFWECSYHEWRRFMEVNVGGIFLCCKYVKPIMERQNNGRIINISSDAIWKGYESQLAYFASKGAVAVMTRNLARELGPFNINVNCVAPGYTLSETVLQSEFMQKVEPAILKSCCIHREQHPRDVAGTVIFLCGEESQCITGQSFVVNCGAIMP
jgi:NAD(P)-dependent dehydrogenase (short-subunit alcohol dehydrogenase family)